VAVVHQVVEFGNRMITFLVVLTAALAVLAVTPGPAVAARC